MSHRIHIYIFTLIAAALAGSAQASPRRPHHHRRHKIHPDTTLVDLDAVVVTATATDRTRRSAFNASTVSTKSLGSTSRTLGDALSKAPGMKLRAAGGTGSDLAVTMDGFNGRHVKIFIDGVPQEGDNGAMALNNLPANFADRIEVYRGVVPVRFGADAIGGAINIVTPRRRKEVFANAAYTFGSFNTHKGNLSFGQNFDSGFRYELNAHGSWSDNDYRVLTPVEDFNTGAINKRKKESVRRFNDAFGSFSIGGKAGWAQTPWADRLMFGLSYSQLYKEIQTGVRQEIVYGQKHRRAFSFAPTLEYAKRDVLVENLNLDLNLRYRRNTVVNVDTATRKYNWRGESAPLNSPGEQSLLHAEALNNDYTASATLTYRLGDSHHFTLNNLFNAFRRTNRNLLTTPPSSSEFAKTTRKDIAGVSYRFAPGSNMSLTAFAKGYMQQVSGPVATGTALDSYELRSRSTSALGYGAAATYILPTGVQLKGSYEKALRLPTIEEIFGNEDLEQGDISLRPESSHNLNLNIGYNKRWDRNTIATDLGLIYRDTRDYIQRNILSLSGGKSAATYVNYGRVLTNGVSLAARYTRERLFTAGGNITRMNVRDNMRTTQGSSAPNISYRERIPNIPWFFADFDTSVYWHNLGARGNTLTLTYDGNYTHSFCYYASNIGGNPADYMVPDQLAHNLTLSYSLSGGRYNLALEARNVTDALLYDNFSLQKPGRAFFATIRLNL